MEEKMYSLRENWELLKPFLEDEDVKETLDKVMIDYCNHLPNRPTWSGKDDAPWKYTRTDAWDSKIMDRIYEDTKYQEENNVVFDLFHNIYGKEADIEEDEYFFELDNAIFNEYYDKHSPKKGEIEFYQLYHGAYWISIFVAELLRKALNVDAFVLSSESYSVASFIMDDVLYYADILEGFESVNELRNYIIGED